MTDWSKQSILIQQAPESSNRLPLHQGLYKSGNQGDRKALSNDVRRRSEIRLRA